MTLYEKLIKAAEEGKYFNVDLKDKNLTIGRKHYIVGGEVRTEDQLIEINENVWNILDDLWINYKHSVPNSKRIKSYFYGALPIEELSTYELANNESRLVAQARLEGFILLANLSGDLIWQEPSHWFWQSKLDKDFIILREWIERKDKNEKRN